MHELSIARSIVEIACAEAERHCANRVRRVPLAACPPVPAARVRRIHCRIGRLRQIDAWLIREAFGVAAADSLAAGAELNITYTEMQLLCTDCHESTNVSELQFHCPRCASPNVQVQGGDELELTSVELEIPNEDPSATQEPLGEQRRNGRGKSVPACLP